ncbi:MAG TPA: GNAT family N-acetyltransferase [Gaiellaceae bacterium]|nr:GNAT family N-acetyltransferase [Gaiellaceae bacterium]
MNVRRLADPNAYLKAVSTLLTADEARHNLMLGILATLRDHPSFYPQYRLWLVEDAAAIQGAAVRTPPHNLVLARPRDDGALEALAHGIDDELPGVIGALPEADAFAAFWSDRTATTPVTHRGQAIFQLDRVDRVSGVAGRMRDAETADRPILIEWWGAFAQEALGETATEAAVTREIDHRLDADEAGIVLWEDGEAVSFAAYGNPTPNGIRIGPVYTPPERRARGYASALVAELSERLLTARRFCFLYTDLANPTSNKIYEQIGYRRVCEAAEIRFAASPRA